VPLRGQLGIEKSELRERLGQLARGDRRVHAIHVRTAAGLTNTPSIASASTGSCHGRFLRLNISVQRDRRERGPRRELEPVAAPAQARGPLHVPLQPFINYPDWPWRLQVWTAHPSHPGGA
jgi:hypothetical protein